MKNLLEISKLKASIGEKNILSDLSIKIKPGEIHAIMGTNGSGKSTLSNIIAGNKKYKINSGSIKFESKNIISLKPEEISRLGIFLAFQHPLEIPGLSFSHFLYASLKAREPKITPVEYTKKLKPILKILKKDDNFISRHLNVGFSGGEKKAAEMLQLLLLDPKLAIIDEIDSGLDIDAMKTIATAINSKRSKKFSALIITHYPKMLELIKPDIVHVMLNGKIVLTGKSDLIKKIEKKGYGWLKNEK